MSAEEKQSISARRSELKAARAPLLEQALHDVTSNPSVLTAVLRAANDAYILQEHTAVLSLGRHLTRCVSSCEAGWKKARQVCILYACFQVAEKTASVKCASYDAAVKLETTAVYTQLITAGQDDEAVESHPDVQRAKAHRLQAQAEQRTGVCHTLYCLLHQTSAHSP